MLGVKDYYGVKTYKNWPFLGLNDKLLIMFKYRTFTSHQDLVTYFFLVQKSLFMFYVFTLLTQSDDECITHSKYITDRALRFSSFEWEYFSLLFRIPNNTSRTQVI